MGKTSIQWTERSANPIRFRMKDTGKVVHFCVKKSSGCAHCYSEAMSRRWGAPEFVQRNLDKVECFLDEKVLQAIERRRKPTVFFLCDMTDWFGEWVPEKFVDRIVGTIAKCERHTFQMLTKRADRMAEYFNGRYVQGRINDVSNATVWASDKGRPVGPAWPLENLWLGVSCENQATADERIPHLLKTPAAVRFLSCEPLIGPIEIAPVPWDGTPTEDGHKPVAYDPLERTLLTNWDYGYPGTAGIDWIIVGGESGKARPCASKWIASLAAQCVRAKVPVFVKQMGSNFQTSYYDEHWRNFYESHGWEWPDPIGWSCLRDGQPPLDSKVRLKFNDRKGGDMDEWIKQFRVRQFPQVERTVMA